MGLSLNDYLYNTVLYASSLGIANRYIIEEFDALENITMKHSQAFCVHELIIPAPRRLSSKFVALFCCFSCMEVSFFGR